MWNCLSSGGSVLNREIQGLGRVMLLDLLSHLLSQTPNIGYFFFSQISKSINYSLCADQYVTCSYSSI